MKTARQLAVEALCQMEERDAWSAPVLSALLQQSELSAQERGFTSALFYGTIVYKYTIDCVIAAYSKRKLHKIDTVVRAILRTALFQLLQMASVPAHAAVSEAVQLTRRMKKASASGYVNSVLRSFLRDEKKLPYEQCNTTLQKQALEYSCPPELIALWEQSYGTAFTQTTLTHSLESPPTFLRVNTCKITDKELEELLREFGLELIKAEAAPHCYQTKQSYGSLLQTQPLRDGYFHIQDLSSQQAALALGVKPGERVLDVCAAPGGKTFVLAQEMQNTGSIVACDKHAHRLEEMARRSAALGLQIIEMQQKDMEQYHPELGLFDRILCDVPCSGYGTVRRRPEIKYRSLSHFAALPNIQLRILTHAAQYCKIGGILVYSTCTLNPQENEQVVAAFLKKHPHFAKQPDALLPGGAQTFPVGRHGGDGFFICRFICNNTPQSEA